MPDKGSTTLIFCLWASFVHALQKGPETCQMAGGWGPLRLLASSGNLLYVLVLYLFVLLSRVFKTLNVINEPRLKCPYSNSLPHPNPNPVHSPEEASANVFFLFLQL